MKDLLPFNKVKFSHLRFYFSVFLAVFLMFLFTGSSTLLAQSANKYQLQTIDVASVQGAERLKLGFDNIAETPIINFDQGTLHVRLPNSYYNGNKKEVSLAHKSQFIRFIRIIDSDNSLKLQVVLKSAELSLEEKIALKLQSNNIFIDLNSTLILKSLKNTPTESTAINNEVKEKLFGGKETKTMAPLPLNQNTNPQIADTLALNNDQDIATSLMTMILALFFTLLLLFGAFYLYNKFFAGSFNGTKGKFTIKTTTVYPVGPKQKVVILNINEKFIAVGVSPGSINFLTEVKGPEDKQFLNNVATSKNKVELQKEYKAHQDFLKTIENARSKAKIIEDKIGGNPDDITNNTNGTSFSDELLKLQKSAIDLTKDTTKIIAEPLLKNPVLNNPLSQAVEKEVGNAMSNSQKKLKKFSSKLSEQLDKLKPIK